MTTALPRFDEFASPPRAQGFDDVLGRFERAQDGPHAERCGPAGRVRRAARRRA